MFVDSQLPFWTCNPKYSLHNFLSIYCKLRGREFCAWLFLLLLLLLLLSFCCSALIYAADKQYSYDLN